MLTTHQRRNRFSPEALGWKYNLLTPQFQISGLQKYKKINFHCLHNQVCGDLFQQPQETDSVEIRENKEDERRAILSLKKILNGNSNLQGTRQEIKIYYPSLVIYLKLLVLLIKCCLGIDLIPITRNWLTMTSSVSKTPIQNHISSLNSLQCQCP